MLTYILPILATLAIAFGVFRVSFGYFQSQEMTTAQGRLSLYQSSVGAELTRFSHLTYVLARDSLVQATAEGQGTGALNERFEDFARRAGLDAIYLMTPEGLAISASNFRESGSFVGQSYAFRPYFREALQGQQGRFYAIGATTGQPGYFIADAVQSAAAEPSGVVAIKIDFSAMEESWRNSGEQVLLANEDGVVLLASDPAWRYKVLLPLDADQQARIAETRQFPGERLELLDWQIQGPTEARIGADHRIYLNTQDLPHGWNLHYFVSNDRAVTRSWLVTAVWVFAAGLILIVFQIQRARRVGRALRRSEREEAQLRESNARLAREIEDRRKAESQLQRTQSELERASRLAALGQLSASVTHELGQPIAAMRNHLVAAELSGQAQGAGAGPVLGAVQGSVLGKITGLVDRMEGITRQLKFFARNDPEEFATFDLRDAVQAGLALVEPNQEAIDAEIVTDLPDAPVLIRGSKLRIEQVITNLLRNALDAVEGEDAPWVQLSVGQDAQQSWLTLRDNGHGLGDATLNELQEPFVTTRESGRGVGHAAGIGAGMGLGLAISASILRDHGGQMSACNTEEGGAEFHVSLPKEEQET